MTTVFADITPIEDFDYETDKLVGIDEDNQDTLFRLPPPAAFLLNATELQSVLNSDLIPIIRNGIVYTISVANFLGAAPSGTITGEDGSTQITGEDGTTILNQES